MDCFKEKIVIIYLEFLQNWIGLIIFEENKMCLGVVKIRMCFLFTSARGFPYINRRTLKYICDETNLDSFVCPLGIG